MESKFKHGFLLLLNRNKLLPPNQHPALLMSCKQNKKNDIFFQHLVRWCWTSDLQFRGAAAENQLSSLFLRVQKKVSAAPGGHREIQRSIITILFSSFLLTTNEKKSFRLSAEINSQSVSLLGWNKLDQ